MVWQIIDDVLDEGQRVVLSPMALVYSKSHKIVDMPLLKGFRVMELEVFATDPRRILEIVRDKPDTDDACVRMHQQILRNGRVMKHFHKMPTVEALSARAKAIYLLACLVIDLPKPLRLIMIDDTLPFHGSDRIFTVLASLLMVS